MIGIEQTPKGGGNMDNNELWDAFKKTGRIADYLRYRGIEVFSGPTPKPEEGTPREPDNRCTDHSGKQQYR